MENLENFKKFLNDTFKEYIDRLFIHGPKASGTRQQFGKINGMAEAAFALNVITIGQFTEIVKIRQYIEKKHKTFEESYSKYYSPAIREQISNCRKYAHDEIQKILETENQTIN